MGTNIELGNAKLTWDPKDVPGSLEKLRTYVEEEAEKANAWYLQRKGLKAWFSRYMRLGAIVATTLGALFPIAAQLLLNEHEWAKSGLIPALLVGVAASLLGADRAFGFSSGWIRYITTAAIIRKALAEFRIDWVVKTSQLADSPTKEQIVDLLQSAKGFRLSVEGYIIEETRAWSVEFQNTVAQLEKDAHDKFANLSTQAEQQVKEARDKAEQQRAHASQEAKAHAEAQRSGSIELSIPNSAGADDRTVKVQLEGEGISVVDTIVGSPRWSRIGLKPGLYRIVVSAQAASKPINDQAVCEIRPGELLKTEIKLPISGP